ncbi:HNH endonuclease family protein [Isoptericola croceus]|uniref:HNH endonuclease family protein n=1 Tax=Isoptericola croceus TaxID=3031406 RepID=UPI0027B935AA|nr:HNH endonuclease family protein [Isoptericola croceus]
MPRSSSDGPARPRRFLRLAIPVVVLVVAGAVTFGDLARIADGPLASLVLGTDVEQAAPGTALAALDDLAVKGRAPKTGYDRDEFGPAWADVDRNGCDTRNDILARDLTAVTYESGTRECVVLTGELADPYTGTDIDFRRGRTTSSAVQIDHVVALSDAWQKGAQALDDEARRELANDPLNLLAVDGPTNGAKGDGDTATWLPPDNGYRCEYVARQVAVKLRYELWVTAPEGDAMERVLSTCPDEPLPAAHP